MYTLQSSSLVPLHYRHGFHSRLGNLNKLLRYFLGIICCYKSQIFADFKYTRISADKKSEKCDLRASHFCSLLMVAHEIGLYHHLFLRWLGCSLYGCLINFPRNCLYFVESFSDITNFFNLLFNRKSPLIYLF